MPDEFEQRFEIVSFAGAGGMGKVYRARDRLSGHFVAVKVVRPGSALEADRFVREAEAVSQLVHPAIVKYVAHGEKSDGERYLATEWLEGENLGEHLRRERPSVAASLRFVRRLADALGAAHRRGIVHRDVKPGNVFLVGRALETAKVIDFGVARMGGFARETLTQTGAMVGTPGYMSPEQARGDRGVDARADVFSLGCVLFKCLTGKVPFSGDDVLSVLAKLVLEEPPRVSSFNVEVPGAVDDLVALLMAKSPRDRPVDGEAVIRAIDALDDRDSGAKKPQGLGTTEKRVVCVALADLGEEGRERALDPVLARAVARQGGGLDVLADGSVLVSLAPGAAFTDQALRAARAARAVAAAAPDGKVALVAGLAEIAGRVPMGDVIDRAVALLRSHAEAGAVRVDALMTDLLEGSFELARDANGATLVGERDDRVGRTFLGKRGPFVGREREVATLEALFEEVASEPVARAAVVTGGAGIGKSRLRDELTRRLAAREDAPAVWLSRADPMRAGAPFGLLAPMVRRALGFAFGQGDGDEARWEDFRAAVERQVPSADAARVAVFLGELASVPAPAEASPQLRAARADPMLLGDQMRRAFEDLVLAACEKAPLFVVLEDIQWGDLPSLTFVDAALRNLGDKPLFVLVTARPEVVERFPKLFAGRPLTELKLAGLTRKASERLVRGVLGARADDRAVERIVAQAGGDAFYLEELIRSVADGGGDALPQTVLASVQARLDRLSPSVRRVLRAASVFGGVFEANGAAALLGDTNDVDEVRAALEDLVERELLQALPGGGPGGRDVLAFRQELVREAAYAMLTDGDRALGHRLAGAHLERAGEGQAASLASHFDRGGEPARAHGWYERAAEQALAGNDLAATLRWCDLASACAQRAGVPQRLGAVLLLAAEAHRWRGELAPAEEAALAAMELLPKRCSAWFVAAGEAAILSGRLGHTDALLKIGDELVRAWAGDVSPPDQVVATARAGAILVMSGAYELADQLLDRVRAFVASPDPVVVARVHQAIATRALVSGDPGTHLHSMLITADRFVEVGDERNACNARVTVGFAQMDMGAYEPAEVALRDALAAAERLGLPNLEAYAKHNLGLVLSRTGRVEEAAQVERAAMEGFAMQGDKRLAGAARAYLGMILAKAGQTREADAELERAVAELGSAPSVQVYALATLVMARLAQGRVDEALLDARRAMALFDQLGGIEEGEALVRLSYAEALEASGDHAGASAAIATARTQLLARADKLREVAFRKSFLERVPDHARTLELAAAWLGDRMGEA